MAEQLPRPVTVEQEYLAAILAELRALRVTPERPDPAPDVVELREPAEAPAPKRRGRPRKE